MSIILSKTHLVFITAILIATPSLIQAQCTSTGARGAGTATSLSFGGSDFNFNSINNIFSSDNNYASSTGLLTLFNGKTEYLQATNFGFSIPQTAIVCGIVAEVEKSATGIGTVLGIGLSYVSDYSVRLVRNGVVTGNNKATSSHWTSSETHHSYGGSSDIWGVAWTPGDINASNFGIAFSAGINGLLMLIPNVRIDHIRITVYYMVTTLPVNLTYFNATAKENNTALIEWNTPPDKNHISYLAQRSRNGQQWETVEGDIHQSYRAGRLMYFMEDRQAYTGASFYRLRLASASGEISFSAIRLIQIENSIPIKAYPNPFIDRIVISGYDQKEKIWLTDMKGRLIHVPNSNSGLLNLHFLHPGLYLLHTRNKVLKIQKQH
jgi:hypothetical protein